jgi:hypothetical protein
MIAPDIVALAGVIVAVVLPAVVFEVLVRADGSNVDLLAEPEGPLASVGHRDAQRRALRGLLDGLGQRLVARPRRRAEEGPSGPSTRATAWKCTTPRP